MISEHFEGITDKRQAGKVQHNLLEIIIMTVCAVIAGCDVWEDIADFCRVKEKWLRESMHMRLENGIPSHDTLSRVFGMIEPSEFEKCFRSWVGTICQRTEKEIVSIDGKTVCGSKKDSKDPLHMVSAWAHEQQLVLGQIATDAKSNEITAVPNLLEVLDVSGCIVTADAMSCQKNIVSKITEKHSDYVIGLKDNQPTLRKNTSDYFDAAQADPALYPEIRRFETLNKGHGRIERRVYSLTTELDWLGERKDWVNLNAIGKVHTFVTVGEETVEEDRYYITSLTDITLFSKAVRAHWGIENSLHWCLDVTFHEDYSRIRSDHSPENMAVVRHLALDILKHFPENISLTRKRRRCSYDDAFLADVLSSVHA